MATYTIKPNNGKVRIRLGLYKHKKGQKKPLPETSEDGCCWETEVSDRQARVQDKVGRKVDTDCPTIGDDA